MSADGERLKVALEWCGAAALTVALGPAVVALGAAVAVTSPGGPLYVATRIGKGGRPFRMLKLRTMVAGAPIVVGADAKTVVTPDDPRVTPLGRVLRRGFDELPQLVNVLRGDMGLVGPRPDPDWMLPRYTPEIRRRLAIRPGITGLAQVLDSRSRLATAEVYALDAWYVEHRSLALDAWILGATVLYLAGARDVGRRRLEALQRSGAVDPAPFVPLAEPRRTRHGKAPS